MIVEETNLPGVLLIKPKVFGDARGFFLETYSRERFHQAGIGLPFVQDNHSHSGNNVLRGLHYQLRHPQGKLVYVSRGAVFDVAVDIRTGSPTFGEWYGVELNDENHYQLYIPPGFAHGFCTMSETVDFTYKCTDIYHPDDEYGVLWSDPDIDIVWPCNTPLLSDKDKCYPCLKDVPVSNLPVL